ncbi:unnamed protein product [Trichogramma brassicae]|uniref:Uncharacterized protein n=1 Tax=Trichogramma brassicae TaxID=86971 RepID=A0A6H5I6S5_9HYME|nr:unnamed protein product [Trichogramma brassicae]
MEDLEDDCLRELKNNYNIVPLFYYRYVDDTIMCIKSECIDKPDSFDKRARGYRRAPCQYNTTGISIIQLREKSRVELLSPRATTTTTTTTTTTNRLRIDVSMIIYTVFFRVTQESLVIICDPEMKGSCCK